MYIECSTCHYVHVPGQQFCLPIAQRTVNPGTVNTLTVSFTGESKDGTGAADHDESYVYQPLTQLSLRQRARLLIMRSDVQNGVYVPGID